MYKSFKLTKRYSIAFEKFNKKAKTIKTKIPAYHTGICKSTDEINEFDTYFFVLGTFRIMWYVEHKHKCGQCSGWYLNKTNMTPQEKAKELIEKYYDIDGFGYFRDENGFIVWSTKTLENQAKQCALIAVDEILKDREEIDGMRVINDPYWVEVKQEIEKL